ncbi:conserved Plasmodium protein, unknown function [Plasmodium vivax]|uniref:Uncharacterized protein n=5 Tax=Plasmodium vivax TaxID=5855 RepID=A5K512_PLAVS|nr:hypothetical protein, conserved [Plasmodium vivax]KMZ80317.1 hypothetical protein PVIIG_03221 [Plasmodium vivax India VII]KMZ92906.1 hypothetical protein PVMG_04618 [Plasmodium vivax Mauritania I]KMZ99473.1 hypothetical protein PVNG_05294 [Plasmodium vivax North Korean]EDL45740.1 hypothetical protein, conserved [Plasmodium vivax]CAG9477103.1 unnamed protein product [Plasmodium vivax]|eukprot:XP_001615467.1 hypothetical protein [Plasmodium vivax Sal-1]
MKGTYVAPAHTEIEVKKHEYALVGVRILSIIATATYVLLFNLLTINFLTLGEEEKAKHGIGEEGKNILKDDQIFMNYYKAFSIINIVCGSFLILLNLLKIFSSFRVKCFCIKLFTCKKYIRLFSLHLDVLFICTIFLQNLENRTFFCNLENYLYWFEGYDKEDLFLNAGSNLCHMHNYAFVFPSVFIFLSLIEFLALYLNTDRAFRKKFFLFYIKLFSAYLYLALFYIFLKTKSFFKKTLAEYNIYDLNNFSDTVKIIIYSTQKHKNYYLQLLIVSTIVSAILFSLLSYYDLYGILRSCKFSLLVSILTNACTLIFVVSQVLYSSYLLEGNLFFCSYEEYLQMTQIQHGQAATTPIAPSNTTETRWFCNLSWFLYVYLSNNFVCLLTFIADFMLSAYMVFSTKYASKAV